MSFARSLATKLKQRAGGVLVPLATVALAFLMGGVVVAATQHGGIGTRLHNTLIAYNQILDGAGLNWFGHFFRHPCLGFVPCHLASTNISLPCATWSAPLQDFRRNTRASIHPIWMST